MTTLSVVGLGKLGICTAACLAYRGYDTIGLDINPDVVATVNAGVAPVHEPHLQDIMAAAGGRLRATQDYGVLVEDSDITLFIVPTPSRDDGHFSDRYLQDALRSMGAALARSSKPYHLFVVTSTVTPGTTERTLIPLVEKTTKRHLHEGFGICYNPEFIALGSVITDFLNPDLVLIGESDRAAGDRLETVYRVVCENTPRVSRMSIVSAEIAKLSLNSYVTMKISFANTLASLCERIPGADVDAVTGALGADRRVSSYGLRGGLPFGGPCFPRDNRAFVAFAAQHGVEAALAQATDRTNRVQMQRLIDLVVGQMDTLGERTVSILGLAYKPHTPVIEESPSVSLVEALLERGATVTAYDPLAAEAVRQRFGARVHFTSSVREAVARSAVTVVAVPLPECAAIDGSYIVHDPAVIIDCWRVLDRTHFVKPATYLGLGLSPS